MAEHNWTEKTQDSWLPRLKDNSLPSTWFWIAHPVTEDPWASIEHNLQTDY